jgi:hypothetical protein
VKCRTGVGQRKGGLYNPNFVCQHFPNPADYRAFVLADVRGRDLPEEIKRYVEALEE